MIRRNAWRFETRKITAFDGSTGKITVDETLSTLKVGSGFYVSGKKAYLNYPNEWFYDSSTKTLFLRYLKILKNS